MDNLLIHNFNNTQTFLEQESGEFVELKETALKKPPVNDKVHNFNLKGKSVQNGEPTPENPIPILNVPSSFDITSCSKNLYNINTPFDISQGGVITYPSTVDGRTMSIYNNSSLNHRNGQKLNLPKNTTVYVRAFFTKVAEGNIDYYLGVRQRNESTGYYSTQIAAKQYQEVYGWNSFSFNTGDNTDELGLFFGYSSSSLSNGTLGIKVSDITLYTDTSELYYDYNGETKTIQINDAENNLHELCSVQDGTADEVNNGKIVKRVIKKIYDGTENFGRSLAVFDRGQYKTFYTNISDIPATNNVLSLYSSHFETGTAGMPDQFTNAEKNCMFTYIEGTTIRALCIKIDYHLLGIADDDAWNALTDAQRNAAFKNWVLQQHTNGTPLTVIYKTNEPKIYDLHTDELSKVPRTYQYYSNIFTNAEVSPTMTFLARKLGNKPKELQNFYLSSGEQLLLSNNEPLEIYL